MSRTYFVPFDGSPLSRTALRRAGELAADETAVLAFIVVPHGNTSWARERDLLEPGEQYDADAIIEAAETAVSSIAPKATFEHAFVGKRSVSGRIAGVIRRRAAEADADIVFLGSENAGHIVTSVADVAPSVAATGSYDVYIARRSDPA
ncbi:universal stress protein [Halorubrum vacuolatum]|nr:universal stress protein [Halorubrum vacuolatum]